jgi:hypothetical protein
MRAAPVEQGDYGLGHCRGGGGVLPGDQPLRDDHLFLPFRRALEVRAALD